MQACYSDLKLYPLHIANWYHLDVEDRFKHRSSRFLQAEQAEAAVSDLLCGNSCCFELAGCSDMVSCEQCFGGCTPVVKLQLGHCGEPSQSLHTL